MIQAGMEVGPAWTEAGREGGILGRVPPLPPGLLVTLGIGVPSGGPSSPIRLEPGEAVSLWA